MTSWHAWRALSCWWKLSRSSGEAWANGTSGEEMSGPTLGTLSQKRSSPSDSGTHSSPLGLGRVATTARGDAALTLAAGEGE
eukprot:13645645-Alexandrium_andersonii.AAC.1